MSESEGARGVDKMSDPIHPHVQPPIKGFYVHPRGKKGVVKEMRQRMPTRDQVWVVLKGIPYM